MKIFVSAAGPRDGRGTLEMPYRTIAEAARAARPGDEVVVAPGIYREGVDPLCGGESAETRITYTSLEPLGAVITGAEIASEWADVGDGAFMTKVPNGIFGAWNPYAVKVEGDWLFNREQLAHAGNVYVDGKSIYEAADLAALRAGQPTSNAWDQAASRDKWYAEVDGTETRIYVHLQGDSPRNHLMEISVRRNVFFPSKTGVNYITVSGFKLTQAATQWAPPTAFQDGLIGPNWSKGWIIEDCEISESKCCGVSLGKCLHPSNNKWTTGKRKSGTQCERDVILYAQHTGWSKETVGSHIVRRCDIHDCDQTGIVGHLGGVFCRIEDNHIHHINNKKELNGAEIAGIKLHAAIDTVIRRNRIHACSRGIWLDWQAQGTRVSQNLLYENQPPRIAPGSPMNFGEDLFVEVSHGPTLVDNNIFLSDLAIRDAAQGLAVVHNLIGGPINRMQTGGRYTPYHFPHETDVAGFMTFMHGDDRYYNNVFVARPMDEGYAKAAAFPAQPGMPKMTLNLETGLHVYGELPSPEEYFARFDDPAAMGFGFDYLAPMPLSCGGNAYFNGAKPWAKEADAACDTEHEVYARIGERNGAAVLETNLYEFLKRGGNPFVSTEMLGEAFEPEERFENPDGSPIFVDGDYLGTHRPLNPLSGPFEEDPAGKRLW